MYKVANLSNDDRQILFRNISQKIGIHEAIVEKDFWVCVMLDYLFHKCNWCRGFGKSIQTCEI